MTLLFFISYVGGVLTILSPCILPVLPFVFTRADQSFLRSTVPLLGGMIVTFAGVASLAAVGGNWAVNANQYGRIIALIVLSFFAVTLLWPKASEWMTRPLVALGDRLSNSAQNKQKQSVFSSFVLGIAIGLLWTPCAGPILGLVLTGAALQGPNATTSLLLLAYALGAATSLALALLAGGHVFAVLKKSLGAEEWIRKGLGVLVLAAVFVILFGLDTGLLTRLSLSNTAKLEQSLIDRIEGRDAGSSVDLAAQMKLGVGSEGKMPELSGITAWLNSPPLSTPSLRGKVVLIDFWTYSCINCLRTLPYLRAWSEKYKDHGLIVIGVHAPEFAFERDLGNVKRAVTDLKITYPVAIDNNYAVWKAFHNRYWPAHYFIDAMGDIRGHHFGEGGYKDSERLIQSLLIGAGYKNVPDGYVNPSRAGIEAGQNRAGAQSPETYIGYARARNFVSPGGIHKDVLETYAAPEILETNQWALKGDWVVNDEKARLESASGGIVFRFRGRDLHLVLGPKAGSRSVRFRVLIDGMPPKANRGVDIDEEGRGIVTTQKLYQLVRLKDASQDHLFEIEFLEGGVEAYSFTFG